MFPSEIYTDITYVLSQWLASRMVITHSDFLYVHIVDRLIWNEKGIQEVSPSCQILLAICAPPCMAQDDVSTQNGSSGYHGAWITGPASNPLSFLNGPAFRTTGRNIPYDFPDFAPMSALDARLPPWIGFGMEERLRWEDPHDAGFKLHNDDGYALNRVRLLMQIKPTSWLRLSAKSRTPARGGRIRRWSHRTRIVWI